jgi:hypothetical protein
MGDWKKELSSFLTDKKKEKEEQRRLEQEGFILHIVIPAFEEIKPELEKHERLVTIRNAATSASLKVEYDGEEEITYWVQCRSFSDRTVPFPEIRYHERRGVRFVRTEGTFGTTGSQKSSVADVTKEDIIRNFLSYYMRHSKEQ